MELTDSEATYDVAIVGAGIAGLALADSLQRAGRSVRVFEARDRVGGRLLSRDVAGHGDARLDLGATWYWPGEHRVVALVDRLDVRTHEQHLAGDALFHQPGGAQRIDGNPLDVPSGRFTDGADSLPQTLATQLEPHTVELSTPVSHIEQRPDDLITVRHADGSTAARHVVLALPPALAAASIEFDPALPDRHRGLAEMTPVWMGAIAKCVAVYSHAFWRDANLAGAAISHLGPMREIHDMSGPDGSPAALFGFAPTAPGAPTATAAACLDQLVTLFGEAAATPLDIAMHDWRAEPWTSPPGVDRLNAYQAFGHALFREPMFDGRLHWCSTETATEAPGHIEGALAAAEHVTSAVLNDWTGTTP